MDKVFTDKLDIQLISLVKEHPVLYDTNNAKYMDFNAREIAWQKIGDVLEKPAAYCKGRWINIRDVHRRILRKSVGGAFPNRVYKYDKLMEFMKPYYKEVVTPTNVDETVDEAERPADSWTDIVFEHDNQFITDPDIDCPLFSKKHKITPNESSGSQKIEIPTITTKAMVLDPSDPLEAFLLSIRASLRKFSPHHLNYARDKIFGIVQQLELEEIQEAEAAQARLSDNFTETTIYFQY